LGVLSFRDGSFCASTGDAGKNERTKLVANARNIQVNIRAMFESVRPYIIA
jgi:hypothetical protein